MQNENTRMRGEKVKKKYFELITENFPKLI